MANYRLKHLSSIELLKKELSQPKTLWGKRYMALLTVTIIASIFYLFIQEEYPRSFPLGSLQLILIEGFILIMFSVDFVVRLIVVKKTLKSSLYLFADALAILPSLFIVGYYLGAFAASELEFLALFRLFRLIRIIKLLRLGNSLIDVFGASVLTLVFSTMAIHLGLRVFFLEIYNLTSLNVMTYLDPQILMISLSAVGSVFGIALAITFGIVKRKQIEISQLHRVSVDALNAFEFDIKKLKLGGDNIDFRGWHITLDQFLNEQLPYETMKRKTNKLLADIRDVTLHRPSLDVPFHNNLVAKMSAFLTKTQIEFNPALYLWLNRIAQLYFVLVMFATPGLTGVIVQLLVIYVFQGLLVVIDDMDHTIDTKVIIFNSTILKI